MQRPKSPLTPLYNKGAGGISAGDDAPGRSTRRGAARRGGGLALLGMVLLLTLLGMGGGAGTARAQAPSLAGVTVVLDPGHGGDDFGVDPAGGDLLEKDVALEIGAELAAQLRAEGATVLMARTTDAFVSLNARVRYGNAVLFRPDNAATGGRLVSIHLNSNRAAPDLRRVEVLVDPYAEGPFVFAADLAAKLRTATGGSVGYVDAGYPEGVHPSDVAPVRWTYPRGHNVLSEAAFLSNPAQGRLLHDPQFLADIAAAHVAALRQELGR